MSIIICIHSSEISALHETIAEAEKESRHHHSKRGWLGATQSKWVNDCSVKVMRNEEKNKNFVSCPSFDIWIA